MEFPADLKYTEEHEWIRFDAENNTAYVGITDFAQSELGELVYVEVETVGETIPKDEVFGTVEAVKTTSDLFMPVSGKVIAFNPEISDTGEDNPAAINEDPYGKGWIVQIELSNLEELENLLTVEAYKESINV